jgi:peptidoglycan/LPS O-acetylase OafA/YrhL
VAWDGVSLVGWPALLLVWESAMATFWLLPSLLTALTAAALRGQVSRRVFGFTLVARIWGMCYSIYLIHYPLISLWGRLTTRIRVTDSFAVNLLIQTALIVPFVLAGSAVFFVLAEKPFMANAWPGRVWSALKGSKSLTRPESVSQ